MQAQKLILLAALLGLAATTARGQNTTAREYKSSALNTAFQQEKEKMIHLTGTVSDPYIKDKAGYLRNKNAVLDVYVRDAEVVYLLWYNRSYLAPDESVVIASPLDPEAAASSKAKPTDFECQQLFSFKDGVPVEAAEVVTKDGTEKPTMSYRGTYDVLLSQQEWDLRPGAQSSPRQPEMLEHAKALLKRYQSNRSGFKPDKP